MKKYLQFRKNYYLCSPLIEDKSAQPADTQLFKEFEVNFKSNRQCYNRRKQNLEGSKKVV